MISSAFANEPYSLQLGVFSKKNDSEANRLLLKAKRAGLVCHKIEDIKNTKHYLFVRCGQKNLDSLNHAVALAKKARLSYYRILPKKNRAKTIHRIKKKIPSYVDLYHEESLDDLFFGENQQFVQIMHGSSTSNIEELKKIKDAYLEEYKKALSYSGLEFQTSVSAIPDKNSAGYDAKLVWNIFDNGYYGYKKEAMQKALQNGMDFDSILKQTQSDYAQIALLEIDEIKKYIAYEYSFQKYSLLKKLLSYDKRRIDKGIITLSTYEKTHTLFQKSKQAVNYLRFSPKKVFDKRYKTLIQRIEKIHLTDEQILADDAVRNDVALQVQKERMEAIDLTPDWKDRIKADVFVDRKRYTSVPRDDTLAGFHFSMPLQLHQPSQELSSIKRQTFKLREKSYKALLQKKVHFYYTKLYESQKTIAQMQKEILLNQKSLSYAHIKREYPIGKKAIDLKHQEIMTRLQMLELKQNIWIQRCEMLKDLVSLQFQTGVKIL